MEQLPDSRDLDAAIHGGRVVLRSGIDAVNLTERLLCGSGAVQSPSAAEGLALAGLRAANQLRSDGEPPSGVAHPATRTPWIYHRVRASTPIAEDLVGFELHAGSAQEAVDHCLVAHFVAAKLGLPGVCTIGKQLAESFHLVELPSKGAVDALPSPEPSNSDAWPSDELVLATIEDAFQEVERLVGRKQRAFKLYHAEGATHFVLCTGGHTGRALDAVEQLRSEGYAIALLEISLVRPFPVALLAESLAQHEGLAVVELGALPPQRSALLAGVRECCPNQHVLLVDSLAPNLVERMAASFRLHRTASSVQPPGKKTVGKTAVIAAAPAGALSERFLLDALSQLGRSPAPSVTRWEHSLRHVSALCVTAEGTKPTERDEIDVLYLAHPSLIELPHIFQRLAQNAAVLIQGHIGSYGWSLLDADQRDIVRNKQLRLFTVDQAVVREDDPSQHGSSLAIHGALLHASQALATALGLSGDLIEHIALNAHPSELELARLRAGVEAVRPLDSAMRNVEGEPYFKLHHRLPKMPPKVNTPPSEMWRSSIRSFYLGGQEALDAARPTPALSLRPMGLNALLEAEQSRREYPLVLDMEGADERFPAPLRDCLEDLELGPWNVADVLDRLNAFCAEREQTVPWREAKQWLREQLFIGVDEAKRSEHESSFERISSALPDSASLLGLHPNTFIYLYAATVRKARRPRVRAFISELRSLLGRLRELQLIDDKYGPEGASASALSTSFGRAGQELIDPQRLAGQLKASRGHKQRSPQERARLAKAIGILESYLESSETQLELVLVYSDESVAPVAIPRTRSVVHPDGLQAAMGLFDGVAEQLARVFKAVRLARLEVTGSYDPELHQNFLARFGWQTFSDEELLLMPSIAVLEDTRRIRGMMLAELAELVRSGRIVDVLAVQSSAGIAPEESWDTRIGYSPNFGYLAVAHQEAFVTQTSLIRPRHLVEGLRAMNALPRPAVAVIAAPVWSWRLPPMVQLAVALYARTTPCFRYDPAAGESWADRFDLSENPQAEHAWPSYRRHYHDEQGQLAEMPIAFTFAHAVAIEPGYQAHFRVLPREAWREEQVELAEFLAGARSQAGTVPYVWVVIDGVLRRAVVDHDLASAAADRLRMWRVLQELAGVNNEYVRRATETALAEARAELEIMRQDLDLQRVDAVKKAEVLRSAVNNLQQLVEQLSEDATTSNAADDPVQPQRELEEEAAVEAQSFELDVPRAPLVASASRAPETAPEASAAQAEPPANRETKTDAPALEQAAQTSAVGPHIDSDACISCSECISINGDLFKYDDEGRAYIADPTAGTYAQLLAAAEKCPAECIYPGAAPAQEPLSSTSVQDPPEGAAPAAPKPARIDSEECISCNQCIEINDQLFVYDDNGQAQIGDRSAGSYQELVRAAEECPAECIHPGEPLPAEEVSAELLQRGRRFND
ncbi:MAG: ferredoxin [Myxococcota bacterium]|nr:ferredoxin [Myxococcota bacterium]